ncbi:MAG: aspartyl-tRNA(Asn)/glutamyl-tRNA(Gln) amidotransferase subunit A [Planctomycetota bacterium]
MSDAQSSDAQALRQSVIDGELSVREIARRTLDAIDAASTLNAFLNVDAERLIAHAERLDAQLSKGEQPGALFGVPVALKANLCYADHELTCGSKLLAGYRPPYTSTVVARLLEAGALPIGSTNMDEFAMGSSGENSAFGPTLNPWSHEYTPGGSSSGSAVAVAAGIVPLALGSDTGGSVRQPAALTGVTGFKPTYGRVSRYGLVAFGSSLDQVSPFATSVADIECLANCISGADSFDSTCDETQPITATTRIDLKGLRIGIPTEAFGDGLEAGVRERVEEAIELAVSMGAERVPISLPHAEHAVATYYVVATAEASSNLARFDGVRFGQREAGDGSLAGMMSATRAAGFGSEVKRRILLGTHVLSSGYYEAWYGRAQRARTLILGDYQRAFEKCDVIVTPTSPTVAFKLGERATDPVAMYLSDTLTVPANLAGLPAVSIPCGMATAPGGTAQLPVGMQWIGPSMGDASILSAARVFQSATNFHHATPPQIKNGATV